jgi:hypothetical protein
MASTEQQERRRQENQCLSILVDLGVTYRRTLGDRVASAYFSANAIPPGVAERIMAPACPRRLTDWERHVARISGWRDAQLAVASAG